MIAIHTKYLAATESKESRIKAYTATGFTATIGYPHEYDRAEAHFEAVKALVSKHKLEWTLDGMRYGDSADGRGYSFCFAASTVESR